MNSANVERRFAAILAADVVKYSIHMAENEERTLERFSDCRAVFTELVVNRRGRMFGEAGDALLAEFQSPVEAVRAAVEIQQALAEKDQEKPDLTPFQFRIGINLGDVMVDGENLYGEGVNLAARIEGLAEPGGIAISSHVHTYIRNKVTFGFEDQGPHNVKNATEPVHVFKLLFPESGKEPGNGNASPAAAMQPTTSSGSAAAQRAPTRLRRPPSKRPVRKAQTSLDSVMDAAVGFMQRSSDIDHGGDRLPWLLFLGGADSGVADLLETAAANSPFTPPDQPNSAETFHWSWWFFKQLIAIETSQAFVEGPSEQHRLDAWSMALSALQANRPTMPITGFVLTVPQHVLRDETACRDHAFALRRLLDQATTMLKVTVPVYLMITRVDDIDGFAEFKEALPDQVHQQAIGHVIEEPERIAGDKSLQAAALQPIFDRFLSLRLGMLRHEPDMAKKRGIFDFIGGFVGLAEGASMLVDLLTTPTELQHDVRLRGVFWVANGAMPAFYQDLFGRFLPQDQPLSHHWTGGGSESPPEMSTPRAEV